MLWSAAAIPVLLLVITNLQTQEEYYLCIHSVFYEWFSVAHGILKNTIQIDRQTQRHTWGRGSAVGSSEAGAG